MTAAEWFVVGLFVVVVLFIAWVWVMNRIDERAERLQREQLRRDGPPVLGGRGQRPGPNGGTSPPGMR